MHVGRLSAAALLATVSLCCAPRGVAGPCSRGADSWTGIPDLPSGAAENLLVRPSRKCQAVFEPAFSVTHAVYFVQARPGEKVTVVVAIRRAEAVETHSASLDARTASLLDKACERFLVRSLDCRRRGVDGVWYHFAHNDRRGRYLASSVWSPPRSSDAGAFVTLAEALRDYGAAREALRPVYWWRLQDAIPMAVRLGEGRPSK